MSYLKKYEQKISIWLARSLKAFSLTWLFTHLMFTFFYAMPVNPIKVGLTPLLNMTIGTFFPQNWSLFAPNPVVSNNYLYILPLGDYENGKTFIRDNDNRWVNMTLPLLESFHKNRFSSYERISRVQSNTIRMFLGANPELYPWNRACDNGDTLSCKIRQVILKEDRKAAMNFFSKIGSSYCNLYHNKYNYFALKIVSDQPIPWSQRHENKPKIYVSTFINIFKVDSSVAASNFYKTEPL